MMMPARSAVASGRGRLAQRAPLAGSLHRRLPAPFAVCLRHKSSWSSASHAQGQSDYRLGLSKPRREDIRYIEDCKSLSTLDESTWSAAHRAIGKHGLDVLDRMDGSDGKPDLLIATGALCLRAYCDYIGEMSIEDAEVVVRADRAGFRVWRWVQQPIVRCQIESNHRDNDKLLPVLSAVLVGAGHLPHIESWLTTSFDIHCAYLEDSEPAIWLSVEESKQRRDLFRWGGHLLASTLEALLWWDRNDSADPAYEFFVRFCRMNCMNPEGTRKYGYTSTFPAFAAFAEARNMAHSRRPASSAMFDQLLEVINITFSWAGLALDRAVLYMCHPTRPSADPILELFRQIAQDPRHFLRQSDYRDKDKDKEQRFRHGVALEAKKLLRRQGRQEDARWVQDLIDEVWPDGFLHKDNSDLDYRMAMKRQGYIIRPAV